MKKIIAILLSLVLVLSIPVTAHAATPTFQIPKVPQISNIKIDVKLPEGVAENAVKAWLKEHPIKFDFSKIKLPAWGD